MQLAKNVEKNFDTLATNFSVLHNYFDSVQQNYFFDLYPLKILDFFQQNRFFCVSS